MKYRELRRKTDLSFKQAGITDHDIDSRYIIERICGLNFAALILRDDEEVAPELEKQVLEAAKRRASHEPLQYILGSQEFMGLEFICSPSCLIPRQDTELLVIKALEYIKGTKGGCKDILDMCTGTGCIAVSVAALSKGVRVTAADISEEALETARQNSERHGTDVSFLRSDLFAAISGDFDLITANPPYISAEVLKGLTPEVREHEPMLALFGGTDGMDFYRRIAIDATGFIRHGGRLMMEIGEEQGACIKDMLTAAGWTEIRIYKDLTGLDRVVEAVWR